MRFDCICLGLWDLMSCIINFSCTFISYFDYNPSSFTTFQRSVWNHNALKMTDNKETFKCTSIPKL